MDLKEGHIMHEQMYPSFLNTDREAIANVRFTWLFMHFSVPDPDL